MFSKLTKVKDKIVFTKTTEETKGEYSELLTEVYSGTGPPMHYHKVITQTFKVLKGVLNLKVGDKVHILKAGDVYTIPPMVPHSETSEKGKLMRCVVEIHPGHKGFEDFMNMTYNPSAKGFTEEEKRQIYLNADTYAP